VTKTTFGNVAGAKGSMTDGGNRVPCIASWPGVIDAGRVCSDIVDFSDFLPTICEATGTPIPEDLRLDGQSFLPQLKGQTGTPREAIYMWYSRSGNPEAAQVFARNQRYKLYRDGHFFDVAHDRLEKQPLDDNALSEEARAIKAMLQTRIDQWEQVR
jgi:arylsulfatase A